MNEVMNVDVGHIKIKVTGYDITTKCYVCTTVNGFGAVLYIPWQVLSSVCYQNVQKSYTIKEPINYISHHVYKSVEDSKITLDSMFHENGEFYYEFPEDRTKRYSNTFKKDLHPKYWEVVGTKHALTLLLKYKYNQNKVEYVVVEELHSKYELTLPYREYILHI